MEIEENSRSIVLGKTKKILFMYLKEILKKTSSYVFLIVDFNQNQLYGFHFNWIRSVAER